jgi:hypothetical protein
MRGKMVNQKVDKIAEAMINLEKSARAEIKNDEEKLLVASALMAVTRNLYIETIGAEDAAHVFASVADSFLFIEEIVDQHKPTIH